MEENKKDAILSRMKITKKPITIRDFCEGYVNNDTDGTNDVGGVTTMNNTVIIRPRFQRSYIRKNDIKWKRMLIYSILKGYPTGTYYLGDNENGTYDNIDGQQRIISICDFINSDYYIEYNGKPHYFHNLPIDEQNKIMNYVLDINVCNGSQSDKLKWFEIINQPISELTKQELRNATYNGPWLEMVKAKFSAPTSLAKRQVTDKNDKYCALRYGKGLKIERQDILELVLDWASAYEFADELTKMSRDERIEKYMAKHQYDTEMREWDFYVKVVDWIWETFLDIDENIYENRDIKGTPHSMVNADWGKLYAIYNKNVYDTKYLSQRVMEMVEDADIVMTSGIYEYLLSGEKDIKLLQIRKFSKNDIKKMYKYQGGVDPIDNKKYKLKDMEAHHINSWSEGGKTVIENMVLLSKKNHNKVHNLGISSEKLTELRDKLWMVNDPDTFIEYDAIKRVKEIYKLRKAI